ncbi:MAG: hypothetical protein HY961_01515 [Ignavibacteriae bacterium]|nr:hypothetical protein [Ignavibacteriota bacterium]
MASHSSVIPPETPVQVKDEIDWKNVVGGVAVLGAFIAIVFAVIPFVCRTMSDETKPAFVVYYPGNVDVDERTQVLLHRVKVGTIREIRPALLGLQLRVVQPGLVVRSEVATLFPPDSIIFDNGKTTLTLMSLTQAVLRHAPTTFQLSRAQRGAWLLTPEAQSGVLMINDEQVTLRAGESAFLRDGDVVGFGGMKLEWRDIESFTRIRVEVDSNEVVSAGGFPDSLRPTFAHLTGYGSEVRVATLFGIAKPSIQLLPSYSTVSLIEHRRSSVKEFAPQLDLDVQGLVENAGAFLFSRSKINASPANRYERAVADINELLRNVSSVSSKEEGNGMLSRFLLERNTLAEMNDMIGDLRAATSSARAVLEEDGGNGLATRLLFKSPEAVERINALPTHVDSVLLAGVPELLLRMNLTLIRAEEVLDDIQQTSREGRKKVRTLLDNPGQVLRTPKK